MSLRGHRVAVTRKTSLEGAVRSTRHIDFGTFFYGKIKGDFRSKLYYRILDGVVCIDNHLRYSVMEDGEYIDVSDYIPVKSELILT